MTTMLESPDDLHSLVKELYALNRDLLSAFHEQRDVYETVLTRFAAAGHQPSAKVLLACREAKRDADKKLRELRAVRKRT